MEERIEQQQRLQSQQPQGDSEIDLRLIFGIITGLAAAVFRYRAGAAVPMLYAVILAAPLRAELDRLKYAKKS